ncbi:MAG: hypothetical protein L6V93_05705 [Clostridiales bacterium]|nr:MAG: hypothetical protein L6V93_05705 [Clostridiales bacterium]
MSGATIITDKEAFKSNNSLAYPFVNQTNSFPALSWETDGAVPATGNACTSWYDEKVKCFCNSRRGRPFGIRKSCHKRHNV